MVGVWSQQEPVSILGLQSDVFTLKGWLQLIVMCQDFSQVPETILPLILTWFLAFLFIFFFLWNTQDYLEL